jgi:hypothetical protein
MECLCVLSVGGYNGLAQQSVYSGHKKCHGHNNQGIITPDGIIVEMYGPFQGRTNDMRMLFSSGLLARCFQHCWVNGVLYYLYGDKGYNRGHPCLQVPIGGPAGALTPAQQHYNGQLSRVRISVEWGFGKVKGLFAYVDYKKCMRLYGNPVMSYWQCAVLLTNCHTCLYGSLTSQYYDVPPPYVEDYLF